MAASVKGPDYLFEVSWEVCNKVGGIYTVIATKALYLKSQLKRHHILIGPDVWMDTDANPDFIEDVNLYRSWKAQAGSEGLRVRLGKWNIPGQPIAILVDYKHFLTDLDRVLGEYWNRFGVDSITGDWDYKESVLFGYVSGKVVESFCAYNLLPAETAVAQFHEWQTGAGLLYLKSETPRVATVFTTHATMVGRCLAGHNLPLYTDITQYDGDECARRFGVVAKHSLEKKSALNATVFTTVSDITARECEQFHGRPVDIVTPNGFVNSFTPVSDEAYDTLRRAARKKLLEVASAMSGEEQPEDSVLIGIGGRYEYRNKGIDVFIDALSKLDKEGFKGRTVNAFIMVPGGHHGPDKSLAAKLAGRGYEMHITQVTHNLTYPDSDSIMCRFRQLGLTNSIGSHVKVYFVPSYLNGNDGIFNMRYYDLLVGLDLALFPSYYEPWGYTPLEALAFKVPTLTTSLAGFGKWVEDHYEGDHPGVTVLPRDDTNYAQVVDGVAERVVEIASLGKEGRKIYMENAKDVASIALWDNQIQYYYKAYELATSRVEVKKDAFPKSIESKMGYRKIETSTPTWKSVMVTRHLPEAVSGLEKLSKNLWWCWNDSAKALFKTIDPVVWHRTGHNPMDLLDTVSLKRFEQLAKDKKFLSQLRSVMEEFDEYMALKEQRTDPSVAYFCMEYGLDTSLKIYSGGLGILAGDYLKETSDMNVNLVAVGFLYRYGYFNQVLSAQGEQIASYDAQNFLKLPLEPVKDKDGNWLTTEIAFPGRNISARIWKVEVGRTDLYLLDSDFEANWAEDRQVTYHLYGGDWENRLKQELLLGIGGVRALRKLGLNPQVYHCNEGHAAFTGLERLREYIVNDGLSFAEALEVVRASSLFTTHTPVPAGHDAFNESLLRKYIGHYPARLNVSWETLMGLGKLDGTNVNEEFSMSHLAANISQNVNGVSMLHGKVSQDIFSDMYPGYLPEELHVSYVTNGVHYATWAAKEWKQIHYRVFGPEFKTAHYDKDCFKKIYEVSDEEVWNTRMILKKNLIDSINERLSDPAIGNHYSPKEIVTIRETLRNDVLTIGFARRFATYKRATLLFTDLDRLAALVNNPERPVQFIFAGKAHPADKAGQDLIKQIVAISKQPRFIGKIVFVPGYDITLAKRMVQGVDVWMNNPTRPQEASGTSGEKASMNGVMHFSVLDGWWVEGYKEGAGWALPQERSYDDQRYQNELDSATIYTILENEIAPSYYDTDEKTGRSATWIGYIKNTIAQVACNFTTNRMLTDYMNQYYLPQAARFGEMVADDYKMAREIVLWKSKLVREWQNIEVVSISQPQSYYSVSGENALVSTIVLNIGNLQPEDVGLEIIFAVRDKKDKLHIRNKTEYKVVDAKDGVVTYQASIVPDRTGMYELATRMFPNNPVLPHRQDFGLVRWL